MGEINSYYHKALEMMDMSAKVMEYMKRIDEKHQAEEAFKQTLEKLWPSKLNEKQN